MPDMWGHDIDVPELKFQFTDLVSYGSKLVGEAIGDHAARMFTPGAVMSGCKNLVQRRKRKHSRKGAVISPP